MTLDIALPAPTKSSLGHDQWRIESLQMANWGGFHGRHEVRFARCSTLMSGASGTGKSTVLDAYLALMMPFDTPFNGASNDASGRARSAEQRNLLTYLRGKMDDSRVAGSEELRDQVLRGGDGKHIWGAVAGTFINDNGRRFTVLRLYFVRAGAALNGDVVTSYATFDGYVDVSTLETLAQQRFDKRSLRAAGLVPFNTFREFEDTVHTRLGIGGGDGGRKAMRLLARVQAGMEVKRVDTLYKSMVLEKPATYLAADRAIEHFADLQASYLKMLDEADKVKTLQRLPELQQDLEAAEGKLELIAAFGAEASGPSPFQLWRLRTERALLDAAVAQNRRDHARAKTEHGGAVADEQRHQQRLDQIAQEKRDNGGDAIDARRREIEELTGRKERSYAASLKLQARTEAIGLVIPETAAEFAEAQAEATAFLEGYEERHKELQEEGDRIRERELAPLNARQAELSRERASLKERTGAMPDRLHQARVKMARAAGLDPMQDLPFAGELIDLLPGEEGWRTAVETTLAGLARTVLVDRRGFDHLSAAIDPVRIVPRLNFQAVDLAEHQDWRGDPDHVSGKLAFKHSPFSRWVQDRVTAAGVDHLCVADASCLRGDGPRVTPSGQTRHRDRGAHGESGDGYVIGFTNERRLADIEAQLSAIDPQVAAVRERIKDVTARLDDLRRQRDAHQHVQDAVWDEIDHLGIAARIHQLEAEIARLRASNSVLDVLQTEEDHVKPLFREANRVKVLTQDTIEKLEKQHGNLVTRQDETQDDIDEIERAQTAAVTAEQQHYLDDLFAAHWDATSLSLFTPNVRGLRDRLREESEQARKDRAKAIGSMEQMFGSYKDRWKENNLGVTVASADGYREILDRIRSEGLHERRDRWRREFAAWSSDDLLRLNDAFDTALEEIEDRLEPINRILRTLPFGGKGVLQIVHRRLANDQVRKFRRELRKLSSGLALELTDQQVETRFRRLSEFMADISVPEGHTKPSTSLRDRYLDVRQHVVITAVCLDDGGSEVATYDSLGGKSGGETQELVAFIVGAALRYQLGDESRSRPRFAPVFLDEGFVKSDSEFAGRSVRAWQDLGFQLVIAAPLDKVTALEPYMDLLLDVTKSPTGYSFVSELRDADDGGATAEGAAR